MRRDEGTLARRTFPAPRTKDSIEILDRLTGDEKELWDLIEKETINSGIGALIYRARTTARAVQADPAEPQGRLSCPTRLAPCLSRTAEFPGPPRVDIV